MTTRPILGLMGKAGSGKDAFAERLVTRHGYTRVAFADAVKGLAVCLDPLIEINLSGLPGVGDTARLSSLLDTFGWEGAKQLSGVRTLLQDLGVGVRDYVGPDAWLRAGVHKIALIPGPVVVTDVRFHNEADWVQTYGTLVRINRPFLSSRDLHVSENELNARLAEHVVTNNGTLADLHATADKIAEYMRSSPGVSLAPTVPGV